MRTIRVPHHFMNYKYKGGEKKRHLVFDSLPVCSPSLWKTHQPLAESAGSRKLTQFLLRRGFDCYAGFVSPFLLLSFFSSLLLRRRRCIIKTKSKDGCRYKAVFEVQVSVAETQRRLNRVYESRTRDEASLPGIRRPQT